MSFFVVWPATSRESETNGEIECKVIHNAKHLSAAGFVLTKICLT